ncbi:hypothetical protein HYC85_004592 [Camellia sinensis]|uniref:galactinol--sucrose galactosyltransferase n=1 Tax=Camellia sinensis TaxID=4442 RepID=A0A7J7HY67_CAMSI|nr:hypothetical protein HYC85_004592 [Camellia sinensis]
MTHSHALLFRQSSQPASRRRRKMTITAAPIVRDGCLMVRGKVVLTGVPTNVVVSPATSGSAAFLGATSTSLSSRHVFNLGVLDQPGDSNCSTGTYKFLCLFIVKIWWMIPRVGRSASEIPMETQMLLLEIREESIPGDETSGNTFYILLLPTLDGPFRTSLQGTSSNELQFCIESGDPSVQTSQSYEAVFMNSGDNPFKLIKDSVKILEKHKGTFSHIESKKIPAHLDWFGWCTWDAFYSEVDPKGIKEGLDSFLEGGCTPKFLIIDDGWQDTVNEFRKEGEPLIEGTQFATRLVDIKENKKFKASGSDSSCVDLKEFVEVIKEKYGLNYLASSGVDGVKVDVQNLLETLGSGLGGRVTITRKYQQALDESIARNFKDNNLIASMCHNSDSIYSSMKSATARASEDFMPNEPTFQTLHIASVAFNGLLLGEIVVPDWDMFHSNHSTADFHGAARAIGGCAVYVSDKPGKHDFKILQKLVLPDGSVLRARYAGRPTRDCLFQDPVMDRKSLLKIVEYEQVVGSGRVSPQDVEFLEEVIDEDWTGDCAVYAFNLGSISRVSKKESLEVSLEVLKCEIFTISPIKVFNQNLHFAPIGLLDMYNSGGALEALNYTVNLPTGFSIKIKGRGCGRFGAYSSTKPRCCKVDMKEEEFIYNAEDGLLTIKLQGECNMKEIEVVY